jgi:hypothetical protein
VNRRVSPLGALCALGILTACTSGQSAVVPPQTSVNVAAISKLQFAVGTANIAGTAGLNTVETFRQSDGLSAVLLDTPKIAGPAGFVVPADPNVSGNVDSGTSSITGSPQVASGVTPTPTTFGETGGAFAYGFAPLNSDVTGTANFGAFELPFYVAATSQLMYILGPGNAYVANFRTGTQSPGFGGYAAGFTDFAAAPVVGSYSLTVTVPTSGLSIPPFTATAKLGSAALLPLFATPTFVSDATGGGSVTLTVPAGCVETLVFVDDMTAGLFYTFETKTTGTQTIAVPDAIGPITAGVAAATLTSGDTVSVYAVGFDYPAIEAAPIGKNPPQTPPIAGANGQADITTSAAFSGTE